MICLLVWFFTSQSTVSDMSGRDWVEPVLSRAQGHSAVPPVRLEPATPRSRIKHSTTALLVLLTLFQFQFPFFKCAAFFILSSFSDSILKLTFKVVQTFSRCIWYAIADVVPISKFFFQFCRFIIFFWWKSIWNHRSWFCRLPHDVNDINDVAFLYKNRVIIIFFWWKSFETAIQGCTDFLNKCLIWTF